jgi:hypothetical protein
MLTLIVAVLPQPTQVQPDVDTLFLVLTLVAFLVGWFIAPRRRRR